MKKVILLAAVALGAISAQAQQAVEAPKFTDNWSVSLVGGGQTPIENAAFWGDMRGVVGLEIEKQVTPILALGIEGNWGINTSYGEGANVFDTHYVGAYTAINLNNLILGYKCCKQNFFEVEAVVGAGWGRAYDLNWSANHANWATGGCRDWNTFATKAGLNFNFNVTKNVTVSFKPSVVWGMEAPAGDWGKNTKYTNLSFDSHNARVNLMAGVTYHIGGKGFKCVKPYDQAEVDALNAQINDLRAQNDACNGKVKALAAENAALAAELAACNKKLAEKPAVKEVKVDNTNSVRYVYFKQGSSKIAADQKPNVEMVAAFMKSHPNATVTVKGYASPEGSKEVNEKIAAARAEAVKTMLVKTYKIKAERINAAGQGVGNMFEEDSWNRVSICTLENTK